MNKILTLMRKDRPLKQSRRLIVLVTLMALVAINLAPVPIAATSDGARSTVVTQATTVPMLAGNFQAINNGPGDQFDPHIDCDIVSYTNDDFQGTSKVRYYDFATNMDQATPSFGKDSLSDVSGSRIVYFESEGTLARRLIIIFDIASQTWGGFPSVFSPALGGNLMAFDDRDDLFSMNVSDVGAYDISTGTGSRLTSDLLYDRNPAVSPTGNAVVWEKCQTFDTGCDIYAAIQTEPGVFTTNAVTSAEGEERAPSTNGQVAVYTSTRDGETDIYFKSLAGGAETRLSMPGDQRNPNIAGNLISFESQVQADGVTQYDVFLYDISTGSLYQVTNTFVNEMQSDITVCNGIGRIVYCATSFDIDIFAFTFQLPNSAENQINDLVELVQTFDLANGTRNSLITKLQEALAAINASDTATACDSITAFINECQAQSGKKKLTAGQAAQLISSANEIKEGLDCP